MRTRDVGWADVWTSLDGRPLRYRRSMTGTGGLPLVHVHGFAISGSYLMPTARRLAHRAVNVVPDLPGYGLSVGPERPLSISALAEALLEVIDGLDLGRVGLVGNSMGCPVSLEAARLGPDVVDRVVLVSPAGGLHNRPLPRGIGQIALDALREPPSMARVAVPDYVRFGPVNTLRLFGELTKFPSLERLLDVAVPTLAVLGERDPLLPRPSRIREVAEATPEHVTVVAVEGAAHAINYSHPGELAHVIASWLDGVPIIDNPDEPGTSRVLDVTRRARRNP